MSHSTVLIIGSNPEDQLEPFYEQGDEGDYYMEKQVEVAADDYASHLEKIASHYDGEHLRSLEEKPKAQAKLDSGEELSQWERERLERQAAYTDEYANKAEAIRVSIGGTKEEQQSALEAWYGGQWDDEGNLYFVTNPNAKWDWYQLGGRWAGMLKLKAGAEGVQGEHRAKQFDPTVPDLPTDQVDQALKGDIDWEGMKAESLAAAEEAWAAYQAAIASGKQVNPYFDFGVYPDETKEHYLARQGSITTFAVLKDGEWYEQGTMGWWGMVSDEKDPDEWSREFEKLVMRLPDDTLLSVYDIHI